MQNYFSDEIIDEVLSGNDIVDVVSSYLPLERKGKYLFGKCPFHTEKTASFSVTPSKQIFYCYSCNKGGNAIHFVMGVENLSFGESIKFLAQKAKISLPEGDNKKDEERSLLKKELVKINTDAARFYHKQLYEKSGEEALKYLTSRKLTEGIIRKFGLGYASNEWASLYNHLKILGYGEDSLRASGLILENKNQKSYDRFRGRIMFPIFDIRGSVIAFGGRVLDDSQPKYLNSPETPVYSKGRTLYALNFVRKIRDKRIIVVEGYMDVIALHQYGIANVVASLGTALTDEQGRLLRMYADEIIISYDTDQAGQKATLRGLDILDQLGCNVKVLKVLKAKDPDEFVKKFGADSFRKILDKSLTLLEYKANLVKEGIDITTTGGKIELLKKTAEILANVENGIEREMYIKKLSREYDIREESLESEVLKKMDLIGKKKTLPSFEKKEVIAKNTSFDMEGGIKTNNFEKIVIAMLCSDNSIYRHFAHRLNADLFKGQTEKKLLFIVLSKLKEGNSISASELLNNIEEDKLNEFVEIIDRKCDFEDNFKAFDDYLSNIEHERLKERQEEILYLLKKNNSKDEIHSEDLKKELAVILTNLNKRKNR